MEFANATCTEIQQVDCHLCPKKFELTVTKEFPNYLSDEGDKRARKLVNFCAHMSICSEGLPKLCPRDLYPLCSRCEDRVEFYWNLKLLKEKIDSQSLQTKQAVEDELYEALVEDYIGSISSGSSILSSENNEVFKLRGLILAEYRKREKIPTQSPPDYKQEPCHMSPASVDFVKVNDEVVLGQVETPPTVLASLLEENEANAPLSDAVATMDMEQPPSSTHSVLENESNGNAANYQPIEKINRGVDNPQVGSGMIDQVQVKEEVISIAEHEDEHEEEEENKNTLEEGNLSLYITKMPEQQRRLLCDGVELLKCSDGRNLQFYECSLCSTKVFIPTNSAKVGSGRWEKTPRQRMEAHIRESHRDVLKRKPPSVEERDRICTRSKRKTFFKAIGLEEKNCMYF